MGTFKDMTGERFGRLTVQKPLGTTRTGHKTWGCLCECGKEVVVDGAKIRSGEVKSCGCLLADRNHGLWGTPEYWVWHSMKQRCENPHFKQYSDYGGRGITVCARWEEFKNFFSDMGERPAPELTIERIDNEKGYSPDNCKWATKTEQQRNKKLQRRNKTGFTGVWWREDRGKYIAMVVACGKCIRLGSFGNIAAAIAARKEGEVKYWGAAQ